MADRQRRHRLLPANAVGSGNGEDIEVYTDDSRTEVLTTLRNLRQQGQHREGIPNRSQGDFIAPKKRACGTTSAPSR